MAMKIQTLKNKLFSPSEIHISEGTVYAVLITIGVSHFLNDTIQSVIPAIYPIIKDNYGFSFAQIGLITLFFQLASSIVQPVVGIFADKRPQPYSLTMGMWLTLFGLVLLAFAGNRIVRPRKPADKLCADLARKLRGKFNNSVGI